MSVELLGYGFGMKHIFVKFFSTELKYGSKYETCAIDKCVALCIPAGSLN